MLPCFLPPQVMFGVYSGMQHDLIKTLFHWENFTGWPLPPPVMLYLPCSGSAALMSALSPVLSRWSQWCLQEWDHFSIHCSVGQCKGHPVAIREMPPASLPACLHDYRLAANCPVWKLGQVILKGRWTVLRRVIILVSFYVCSLNFKVRRGFAQSQDYNCFV